MSLLIGRCFSINAGVYLEVITRPSSTMYVEPPKQGKADLWLSAIRFQGVLAYPFGCSLFHGFWVGFEQQITGSRGVNHASLSLKGSKSLSRGNLGTPVAGPRGANLGGG